MKAQMISCIFIFIFKSWKHCQKLMLLSTTAYYEDQLPKEVLSNLLKGTMTVVAGSDISIPSSCSLPILFSIKTLTFQLTA